MKIESADVTARELLNSNFFFVPRFQRPYSWDDDNISDFWDDIIESGNESYFIGSMVLYRKKDGEQIFGIVDGQQRLTTIAILLSAVRNALSENDEQNKAKGLHRLIEREDIDNNETYVLNTETSYPYLQEHIFNNEPPSIPVTAGPEEVRIEKAFRLFQDKLHAMLVSVDSDPSLKPDERKDEKIRRLVKIRDAVLNLNVIQVTLETIDDAYLIFETLNTRGKDLALADLVKNLFSRLIKPKGGVDSANINWANILDTFAASEVVISPDDFFVHSWASRFEAVTQKKAFAKFKQEIKISNAKQHLSDFLRDAELYRSVFEPSYKWDKSELEISRSLEAFRLFKLVQPTPAVLSLVRAYRDSKIKNGKLRDTLQAIEKFHFAFTAVTSSRSSGGISSMYSSFARKLFEAESSMVASQEITILINKLRERRPTISEFSAAMEQIIYTKDNASQRNLVRYILTKLAAHEGLKSLGDSIDQTIEHFYPQSGLSEIWPPEILGQLGNLFLVDGKTNEKLGDKSDVEKLAILNADKIDIPIFFETHAGWSPELVKINTQEIAERAYNEVWKF